METVRMQFTVAVDVSVEDAKSGIDWVGRQVENMIENNSDWTAWVDYDGSPYVPLSD